MKPQSITIWLSQVMHSSIALLFVTYLFHSPLQAQQSYQWPDDSLVRSNLEQWQEWKFGMIIHWGPYSQWGVVESWSLCPEDEPWCERKGEYAGNYYEYVQAYEKLPEHFYPMHFQPEKWAAAAKAAGMKYMIFTTKHHDGFCMFDSKFTDYKITGQTSKFATHTLSNITSEVFDAFRQQDIKVGAYFSKPDWNHQDYWWPYFPAFDRNVNYDPEKYPDKWERFKQFTYNQIEELMTDYGRVDLLWLDGGWVRPAESLTEETKPWLGQNQWIQDIDMASIAGMARRHQPGILIVDRSVHGEFENYRTPEQQIPESKPDYPWESCITLGDNWYSASADERYKSSDWIIHTLIKIVAKGGNLLLGIGPDHTGDFVPEVYQKLNETGQWLDKNGEGIYHSVPLFPYEDGDFCFTQSKDTNTFYIFFLKNSLTEVPAEIVLPQSVDWDMSEVELLSGGDKLLVVTEKSHKKIILPDSIRQRNRDAAALVFKYSVE